MSVALSIQMGHQKQRHSSVILPTISLKEFPLVTARKRVNGINISLILSLPALLILSWLSFSFTGWCPALESKRQVQYNFDLSIQNKTKTQYRLSRDTHQKAKKFFKGQRKMPQLRYSLKVTISFYISHCECTSWVVWFRHIFAGVLRSSRKKGLFQRS